MAILIVSSVFVVVGASLWWLFRRPSQVCATADLPPTVSKDLEIVSQLTEEERTHVKNAFLSGDDFRWMVAGKDYKTNLDREQHERLTSHMMHCMISFCQRHGVLVVCRSGNGDFEGLVGLIPPCKSRALFALHFLLCVIPQGRPVAQMGKDVSARFDAHARMIEKESGDVLKGIPHWHA